MDQSNTATPDELQQTINSITNPGGDAAPAIDLGTPPVPDVAGLSGMPPVPDAAPADAPADVAPVDTAPAAPMDMGKASYGDDDLGRVKSMALSDLRPILEKTDLDASKKFKVYKEIIEMTDDKACIELAYNAAKAIEDEKEKADALLFVVDAIDKLGVVGSAA